MTRKCRDMEAWLSAYLENDLSSRDAAEIEQHLAECADCRAKKEKMEELIFSLSELQEEVPFFLKNRLYNIPEIVEKKARVKTIYSQVAGRGHRHGHFVPEFILFHQYFPFGQPRDAFIGFLG